MKNLKIGVICGDQDDSRSLALSPFGGAYRTSYSPFRGTVSLSCTVFEIQRIICRKWQFFATPRVFGTPIGVIPSEFHQDVWLQKTRLFTRLHCVLCGDVFIRFDRTPTILSAVLQHLRKALIYRFRKLRNVNSMIMLNTVNIRL